MSREFTAVSAPGKVLVAGGYLVLDPKCTGLVFSLSARIHCIATTARQHDEDNASTKTIQDKTIIVESPQFKDAEWNYSVQRLDDGSGVKVSQMSDKGSNKFVQTTLRYVLTYLFHETIPFASMPTNTTITILADNDYYSQPSPPIPRFNNLAVPISSANKTGLGSSASLVTSLTACLLAHFSPTSLWDNDISSNNKTFVRTVHNLAQAAHCAAQGKVGSGFDVAAATYGSCAYSRFSQDTFHPLDEEVEVSRKHWAMNLQNIASSKWEMTVEPKKIPKGVALMMCDVVGGSETPGMVKQVLAWKKTQPGADKVWQELDDANKAFIDAFSSLSTAESKDAAETLKSYLKTKYIPRVRKGFARLGIEATVHTEPPSQTRLLDAVSKIDGVLGGVVPGAGGFDAICILYDDKPETKAALETFLAAYRDGEGIVKPLETREDQHGGLKFEVPEQYHGVEYLAV